MAPSYVFQIVVADEGAPQLESCLGFLRSAYPDHDPAFVKVISDGVNDPGYAATCDRHRASYIRGCYLKRVECGGAWWRRFFEEGLATRADYLVKLDPDARVLRPFSGSPPYPISGTVENAGKSHENVQGGCQVIERRVAEKILNSPLLDSPCLRGESTFVKDDASRRWVRSQAYLSTDLTLGWLARNLGIAWGDWSEVGSRWKPPAPVGDYAVTHPHKLEIDGVGRDTPLRVITTCKGRLEHLKVTLPRWLAEPGVDVSVVDYECPDGTAEWVRANHPTVDVVKVRNVPKFHLSRARNLGARHSPAGWWCFWDADLLCEPGWARAVRRSIRRNRYLLASPIAWSQFGSVVLHSSSFGDGYDEMIRGWGAEDGDFYARLRHAGVRPGSFPGKMISSIPHSDEDRTKHYEVKSKPDSQRLNEVYLRLKTEFIASAARLPNSDERIGFLAEAYEQTSLPIPGWFYDPASESPPSVELIRGTPKFSVPNVPAASNPGLPEAPLPAPDVESSGALLAQGESSVTVKRYRDHQTGAPIVNISVVVQNVGSGDCSQVQPYTKTAVF